MVVLILGKYCDGNSHFISLLKYSQQEIFKNYVHTYTLTHALRIFNHYFIFMFLKIFYSVGSIFKLKKENNYHNWY